MSIRPRLLALILSAYVLLPHAAVGAERMYCAASDAAVDLSLEIGFDKRDLERLNHFRGIAALKGQEPQSGTQRFELGSDMIRQYWIDNTQLRFSLRNTVPNRRPAVGLSIVVRTERKSLASLRFDGVYEAKLVRYTQAGTAAGETVLEQEAPIFCSIKR